MRQDQLTLPYTDLTSLVPSALLLHACCFQRYIIALQAKGATDDMNKVNEAHNTNSWDLSSLPDFKNTDPK
jgi:hypothetical protein